jgi:hypothetical protein
MAADRYSMLDVAKAARGLALTAQLRNGTVRFPVQDSTVRYVETTLVIQQGAPLLAAQSLADALALEWGDVSCKIRGGIAVGLDRNEHFNDRALPQSA